VTCRHCGAALTYERGREVYLAAGSMLCTPAARGARCAFESYRAVDINPLELKFHDGSCNCQASILHVPTF